MYTLPRVGVVRTLVTSAIVGAAGSARAGAGAAELAIRRAPSLIALGARASLRPGAGAARAEAVFRDELLLLLDDVAQLASRHARQARLQLSALTAPPLAAPSPTRRARVKA